MFIKGDIMSKKVDLYEILVDWFTNYFIRRDKLSKEDGWKAILGAAYCAGDLIDKIKIAKA